MRYLLRYHLRLGDVVRCLPIAADLAERGHDVLFECLPEYHGIFALVDYARPVAPGEVPEGAVDRTLDLQVWPLRYDDYRARGLHWDDYVYDLYPEGIAVTDRRPRFSCVPGIEMPDNVALVAPFGFSQVAQPEPEEVAAAVREVAPDARIVFLASPQIARGGRFWNAPSLPALAAAILAARWLFTVDSAPNILAAAVGRKAWHYFPTPLPQDAYRDRRQIRLPWTAPGGRVVV